MAENVQDTAPKKKRSKKSVVLLIIAIICFIIAAVCAGLIGSKMFSDYQADQAFISLADDVKEDTSGKRIAKLQKKNADTVAWIKVKDTKIDYPVMYTPKEPEYYLRRDFDKNYSIPGTPFVGANCTVDDNCFIIYGHHIMSGIMFGQLEKFNEKSWSKKHDIYLTTIDGTRTYKVWTAWYEDLSQGTEYRYWDHVGELSKKEWEKHVKTLSSKGLFHIKIADMGYGDNLLMLSTCSYGTSKQRFIVAAIEVRG